MRLLSLAKPSAVLLLCASTLGLIHCGPNGDGPPTSGTASKQVDACTLLTNEEVTAVMGEPVVGKDSGGTADGTTYCHWSAENTSPSRFKMVTVMVNGGSASELYGASKDQAVNPKPVDLGDEAFTDDEARSTVHVLDSGWFLSVGYGTSQCAGTTTTACAENLAKSVDLAKKALARAR